MKRILINVLKFSAILIGLIVFFYLLFYFLVISRIKVTTDTVNTYQFYELIIIYISSCVTTLALIVALLKDEIRYFFISAKIVVKPKSSQFLIEKYDSTSNTIKAESYQIILNVMNNGSLYVNSCSIALIDLEYCSLSGHSTLVDISTAENINWMGKGTANILLHSYGGKAEVSIMQIKSNDASTTDAGQSQPVKLFIGGIDTAIENISTKGSKWIATFMISYDTNRPIKYKLEINWDGEWHDRLTEMLKHSVEFKEVKK
ncbi:MAG TPA: hypothetical protein VGN20_05755 [Mucilaginibacter sp.]|jgi:hypothetical protein